MTLIQRLRRYDLIGYELVAHRFLRYTASLWFLVVLVVCPRFVKG